MGMVNVPASYWRQMHEAGVIKRLAFSLCFSRQSAISEKGTEAGAMTMGGTDIRLHQTPMTYASIPDGGKHIRVRVRNMYLMSGGSDAANTALPDTSNARVIPLGPSEADYRGLRVIVDSGKRVASLGVFDSMYGTRYGE